MAYHKRIKEPDPYDMNIHPLVRMLVAEMNRRKFSRKKLIERTDITASMFNRWRTGTATPDLFQFEEWCKAMDCELVARRIYDGNSI